MIISATGHRPQKIGGFKTPNPIFNYICKETEKHLINLEPEKCISGMALGYDQWFAKICIKLKIPFIAAVPFEGQERVWPKESKREYEGILRYASEVIIVSPGGYAAFKMQVRNKWMVDNSDKLLAAFDGTPGGTNNCITYAKSIGKVIGEDIIIINPKDASP